MMVIVDHAHILYINEGGKKAVRKTAKSRAVPLHARVYFATAKSNNSSNSMLLGNPKIHIKHFRNLHHLLEAIQYMYLVCITTILITILTVTKYCYMTRKMVWYGTVSNLQLSRGFFIVHAISHS